MGKLTTVIQLIIALVAIVFLSFVNYRYLQVSEAGGDLALLYISKSNHEALRNLVRNSHLYVELENQSNRYKQELEASRSEVIRNLDLLSKGGVIEIEGREYKVDAPDDSEVQRKLTQLRERFREVEQRIVRLKNIPRLYEQNRVYTAESSRTGVSRSSSTPKREVLELLKYLETRNTELVNINNSISDEIGQYVNNRKTNRWAISTILMTIAAIMTAYSIFYLILRRLYQPLVAVSKYANDIAEGKSDGGVSVKTFEQVHEIEEALDSIAFQVQDATDFAFNIGSGNFEAELIYSGGTSAFGRSLTEMRNRLREINESERKRNWTVNGLAKLSDVLSQSSDLQLNDLAFEFIKNLVKYVEFNQGGVFLLRNPSAEDSMIDLVACYAYEKRKYQTRELKLGQGLVGQAIKEQRTIYIEEVPDDYLHITSGLGRANPRSILIVPVRVNERVLGAVELASFNKSASFEIEFVETICERFGSTVSIFQMNLETQRLLEESRQNNQLLQAKEEQMQHNNEQLEKTQQELSRKLTELNEETNLSTNIIEAINKTNATVEFDLKGRIMAVNDMYLSVMGYTREELIGKNERILVPGDELNSQRYKLLWESLQNGSFISGEYRRVNKFGKEVWLNGTYNPLFDVNGEPYKIIQFAQFTTEEKEKDLDFTGKINAISASFPLIDTDLEGKIKSVNKTLVGLLGYKRLDLRSRTIHHMLDTEDKHTEQYLEEAMELVRKDRAVTRVLSFRSKTGETRYCLTSFNPIKNLSGNIHKLLLILVDITDRKQLETEIIQNQTSITEALHELTEAQTLLQRQKAELETRITMLNRAANIFEIDQQGRFTVVNNAFRDLMGRSRRDLLNANMRAMLAPRGAEETVRNIWDELRKNAIYRGLLQLATTDGNSVWADTTIAPVVLSEGGEPDKYLGIIFDVTRQVEQENALRESLAKERLKNAAFRLKTPQPDSSAIDRIMETLGQSGALERSSLLSNGLVPTLIISKQGKPVAANELALDISGYHEADLFQTRIEDLVTVDDPAAQRKFYEKVSRGDIVEQEAHLHSRLGGQARYRFVSLPLFGEDGAFETALFIVSADVEPNGQP